MFPPWLSNDAVGWSDGPVESVRVQAAEVMAPRASRAIANHRVVVRDM